MPAACLRGAGAEVHAIAPGHEAVVAIDTLVEDVHFAAQTRAVDVGFKAMAVNLSDLAAMAAEPLAARIALTLPWDDGEHARTWLEQFERGVALLARRHGVRAAAPACTRGHLSATVEAIGSVPRGTAMRRAGAAPGDLVAVTGTLGDAGLALAPECAELEPEARRAVRTRLERPEPRIDAGLALRGLASAAIDVSDGLCADLGHVLAASAVGAELDVECLPLSPVLADAVAPPRAWSLALASGDDYELCFTIAPQRFAEAETRLAAAGCPVTRIGRVVAGEGLIVRLADGRTFEAAGGYRHFC